MKKTNTKKALGMSLISLLACGVMFAGSTYAWFTDEVVASGNKIETGTLKVDLAVLNDDGTWASLRDTSAAVFGGGLWEPGYTDFAVLKVENEGNLANRWDLKVVKVGADSKNLAEAIDVYLFVSDDEITSNPTSLNDEHYEKSGTLADLLDGGSLLNGTFDSDSAVNAKYIGIMLHMREDAGNEYQGATDVSFDLKLNAYQLAKEVDGFGNSDYDKVEYIDVDSSSNIKEVLAGVKGKAVVNVSGNVDATSNTSWTGLDVTFVGTNDDATIDFGSAVVNASGSNVRFENMTVKSSNTNYKGLQHSESETYVNCQIEGKRFLYGNDVTFDNCTFVQATNDYNVWTYGADNVDFNNCTFYSSGKAVLVYNESKDHSTNVNVTGCTFYSDAKGYTSSGDWVSSVEIDSSLATNATYTVNVTDSKYSTNFSDVARIKNEASMANTVLTTTGNTALAGTVVGVAGDKNVDEVLGDTLTGDATVEVLSGGNMVWTTGAAIGSTPFGSADVDSINILGAGSDVSTLTFTGKGVGAVRANGDGVLTVKDVTVVDETVSYAENSWEFGYLEIGDENSTVNFENVVFESAIMVSGTATFKNCTFNSPVANEYGVWVNSGTVEFENCTFTGARGLKIHEAYGSEVTSVAVKACEFVNLTVKPGIAIGTLNAATAVAISGSTFTNCQPGDQKLYIYETDTDVTTFKFTLTDNTVK